MNFEFSCLNEDFSGHQEEDTDALEFPGSPTGDLDKSAEDREEAIVKAFFNGDPCCTSGLDKRACWTNAGRGP